MSPWRINQLGKAVLQGAVFAYPTDTIWGFGCHPLIAESIATVLAIKQRPIEKGLILLASNLAQLRPYLSDQISADQITLLQQPTEAPTTWLVKASPSCPVWIRGQFSTVAIRLCQHPLIEALCDIIQAPLISTSANRSGKSPVRNAIAAHKQFDHELDFVIGGYTTGKTKASKIKSLDSFQELRT